jgi:low temperature requirement protein LtrA
MTEADTDGDALPLRVSTLEIFFDLVFAFTLTQLTAVLASQLSWLAVGQVLLIFGLLWWMYGGYVWLTNARPPVRATERLLLLVAMGGFLVIGLAIPRGFASYGLVLGLGYLLVVLVHACLFYRVNANILRIAPFNICSALLITTAGLLHDPAGAASVTSYALWVAALAIQLGSPLLVSPASRFELRPSHYTERHSALLIVAIGESVAAVGIGAAGPASQARSVSWQLLAGALLGLAVAAVLWWIVFGAGDEQRAERVLAAASSERRTSLILGALFYGNIPLLLGLVALAAGVLRAVMLAAGAVGISPSLATRTGQAAVLAAGGALFLAGDVIMRWRLGLGPVRWRMVAALLALATTALGAAAGLEAQLVVIAAVMVLPLLAERWPIPGDSVRPEPSGAGPAGVEPPGGGPAGSGPSGTDAAG